MKQYEAVIETLKRLGGAATLGQLNQEVMQITECTWKTKTPFASIRRIVQDRPEIYRIKPGRWALESHRQQLEANGMIVETSHNRNSKAVEDFNHSYYQGLLLQIGNMEHFQTYVPSQDKNKRFLQTPLAELNSLQSQMPAYSYEALVHRSSTVDVIWFSDFGLDESLLLPAAFYEIEHSTDIQNSLLKFNDLRGFNAKMFIVADAKREEEFRKKMSFSAFHALKKENRVVFLDYERLVKIYENKMALRDVHADF